MLENPMPALETRYERALAMGRRVLARREALGLSREDLARLAGYERSAGSIDRIEDGGMPAVSHVPGLCRALRVDPNWLFGWEDAADA